MQQHDAKIMYYQNNGIKYTINMTVYNKFTVYILYIIITFINNSFTHTTCSDLEICACSFGGEGSACGGAVVEETQTRDAVVVSRVARTAGHATRQTRGCRGKSLLGSSKLVHTNV